MSESIQQKRERLLNLLAGGDGNTAPWIESVGQQGFIVHIPQRTANGKIIPAVNVPTQTWDVARGLLHVLQTGAKPRKPKDEDDSK